MHSIVYCRTFQRIQSDPQYRLLNFGAYRRDTFNRRKADGTIREPASKPEASDRGTGHWLIQIKRTRSGVALFVQAYEQCSGGAFINMASHPTAGDLQIVKSIALFRNLEPETVKHIIAPATAVTLKAHTTIFRQGELATAFFIMIDGWTKHYRLSSSGDEAVTHVLTRGDSFAESVALTGARFPATAETVTDARIVRIPADHVIRCIQENPNIALGMIASTSQRLRDLMIHIEQLKAKSGVQRVAEFLASLAPVDSGPCVIALPYDKVLVAA